MCNRFRSIREWSDIPRHLHSGPRINFEFNPNVAPSETVPVLIAGDGVVLARFGIHMTGPGGMPARRLHTHSRARTGARLGTGLVTAFLGAVFLVGVFAIVSAPFVMYFSGTLTFIQALRISAVGYAAMSAVMLAFYVAIKPVFGTGAGVEGLVSLFSMCLAGGLITKLAARNGIKKTGLLGVGAKAVLSLLAISWVLVGFLYLVVGH